MPMVIKLTVFTSPQSHLSLLSSSKSSPGSAPSRSSRSFTRQQRHAHKHHTRSSVATNLASSMQNCHLWAQIWMQTCSSMSMVPCTCTSITCSSMSMALGVPNGRDQLCSIPRGKGAKRVSVDYDFTMGMTVFSRLHYYVWRGRLECQLFWDGGSTCTCLMAH